MHTLKVFVSSTVVDLQAERAAVEAALAHLRDARFVGMEHFGARSEGAAGTSLNELDRCDLYVGLIGWQRGSGITELEYRRALERGLPCLVYQRRVAQGDDPADRIPDAAQRALRQEMRGRHVVVEFDGPQDLALRVVADLHRVLMDRLLAPSGSGLAYEADVAIQRFVAEYTGSAAEPSIFGGRTDELERLDRWVDDPQAPPSAVVAAPAGRGKSALLVHWVQRHAGRQDLRPVFFPISIRFRTHLAAQAYASIASRLAALHNEPVGAAEESATEVWRGLLLSYLSRPLPAGVRAVIVIDGADEAGDWQLGPDLLPARPPEGLKVLVSARYLAGDGDAAGWLHRLGWARPRQALALDLRPLTPAELVALLEGMSVPLERFGQRSDVVAELYRLSEGDPLLVKLYVADLWAMGDAVARLQPADLRGIEPGLEGYFRRWWDDQRALWGAARPLREPAVNDLLNTLACALGPLGTGELLELLPPEREPDLWAMKDTLQVLGRFVVGDGESQGYVFGHPRLGDFFFEQLRAAGRAMRHEQRFVDWGLRCLRAQAAGGAPAEPVPTYVPQFLRRHMERCASAPELVAELVSPAWMQAWAPLDRGSHAGFLADMTQAGLCLAEASAAHAQAGRAAPLLATELRAALFGSSIASLAADLSPQVLTRLVARGVWTPAQAIAQVGRIPERAPRAAALVWLGAALEPAFRPLALAALVTELRALTEPARDPNPPGEGVEPVLQALLPDDVVPEPDSAHGERLALLAQAAGQLGTRQRQALLGLLCDGCGADAVPPPGPAAFLVLWRRLDPVRVWSRLLDADASGLGWVLRDDGALAHERLALMRAALDRLPLRTATDLQPALRAALAVLLQQPHRPGARAQVLALARWLPQARPAVVVRLGPALEAAEALALLHDLQPEQRLRVHAALLEHAPVVAPRALLLADLGSEGLAADAAAQALAAVARWLDDGEVEAVLGTLAARDPERQAVPALALLLAQLEPGRWPLLARRLHACLAQPSARLQRALADLQADSGRRDSLTPRHGVRTDPGLLAALRLLLKTLAHPGLGLPPFGASEAEVGPDPVQPDPALGDWLRLRAEADLADVLAGRFTLLVEADDLAAAVAAHAGTLEGQLQLLQSLLPAVGRSGAREAVARLLEEDDSDLGMQPYRLAEVATLACAPALRPPVPGTLLRLAQAAESLWKVHVDAGAELCLLARAAPLPDSLRDAWAVAALEAVAASQRDDGLELPPLPLADDTRRLIGQDILGLAEPSLALLRAALRSPLWGGGPDGLARSQRLLLARSASLPLGALLALLLDAFDEPGALLACVRSARTASAVRFWNEALAAAAQLPSPGQRAAAVRLLAPQLPPDLRTQAIDLVVDLRDEDLRLDALCDLMPWLALAERRRLLPDALALLRSLPAFDGARRRVLGWAASDPELPAPLRDASLALALAAPRSLERQRLVALISPRLDDDTLRAATARLQRLEDLPAQVQALTALARRALGTPAEAACVARLLARTDAIADDAQRHAAVLGCAALLPPAERWPRLQRAFAAALPLPEGFDADALGAELCRALTDAPGAVCRGALDWFAPPRGAAPRTRPTPAVLAQLPLAVLWLAEARLGGGTEDWDALLGPAAWAHAHGRRGGLPRALRRRIDAVRALRAARRPIAPDERLPAEHLAWRLRSCRDSLDRATVLRAWALARDADLAQLPAALPALQAIVDAPLRVDTLAHMAHLAHKAHLAPAPGPYDPPDPARQPDAAALAAAVRWTGRIAAAGDRAWALLRLAGQAPAAARPALQQQALQALHAEPDRLARLTAALQWARSSAEDIDPVLPVLVDGLIEPCAAEALAALLSALPDPSAARLVPALAAAADARQREHLFGRLGSVAGEATALALLEATDALDGDAARARVLQGLAALLPDAARPAAEARLERLQVDFAWLQALQALATRWPALWTAPRLARGLPLLGALCDDEDAASWLQAALPLLPASAWPGFFDAVARLGDAALQAEVLVDAARRRPDADGPGLAVRMRAVADPFQRAVALGQLATLRDDATLWPEVLADAALGGGQRIVVEALGCIATAAGRVAAPLLQAWLQLHARQPRAVQSALAQVVPLLEPAQAEELLRTLPPQAQALVQALHERLRAGAGPEAEEAVREPPAAAAPVEPARPGEPPPLTPQQALVLLQAVLAEAPPWLEAPDPAAAAAAAVAPDAPPDTPARRIERLDRLEAQSDRVPCARSLLAGAAPQQLTELATALRPRFDAVLWPQLLVPIWPRWAQHDALAAVRHAIDALPPHDRDRLLAVAPPEALAAARAALQPQWRRWLDAARSRPRAQVLTELGTRVPLLAALGDEGVLAQAMDEVEGAARLWP